MKISEIRPDEYSRATEVWQASVRATHGFVSEADLQVFRPLVLGGFPKARQLVGLRAADDELVGFLIAEDGKVEALFLDPSVRGQGGGKLLLDHAIKEFGTTTVDVNEQNPQAVGFYLHQGFEVIGRSALDELGKPYPILHLRLSTHIERTATLT